MIIMIVAGKKKIKLIGFALTAVNTRGSYLKIKYIKIFTNEIGILEVDLHVENSAELNDWPRTAGGGALNSTISSAISAKNHGRMISRTLSES